MTKRFLVLFLIILLTFSTKVLSKNYYPPNRECNLTNYYDANTSITFYGDSRGELVHWVWYGESPGDGWIPYFDNGSDQHWNIQNLAVAGKRTRGLYRMIVNCSIKEDDLNPWCFSGKLSQISTCLF